MSHEATKINLNVGFLYSDTSDLKECDLDQSTADRKKHIFIFAQYICSRITAIDHVITFRLYPKNAEREKKYDINKCTVHFIHFGYANESCDFFYDFPY